MASHYHSKSLILVPIFFLITIWSMSSNNAILVQARNLLEETSPEIPDELPKPELPPVELPTLPGFPSLPEIFKSIFPTFPNKEIPEPNKLTSSQSTTSTTTP
ncbi:hypothetical protein CCACVL1_10343 [Corchorus capsularis]|uniref:Hydroxyproline-rich glycoprotein family protein n=1 Tax=Corchorus capsularis TaxID=210143 RepID=A0A1R3IRP4_COCAP|nr:hypothetical protein CCACVL1_10343 [Corchorus capsularis]